MDEEYLAYLIMFAMIFAVYYFIHRIIKNGKINFIVAITSVTLFHSIDYLMKGYIDPFIIISAFVVFFAAYLTSLVMSQYFRNGD
jgi:hypothetical protein